MLDSLLDLVRCIQGPRLFMIYSHYQDPKYKANLLEYFADTCLSVERLPLRHPIFTSFLIWIYAANFSGVIFTREVRPYLLTIAGYFSLMGVTYLSRGLGRFINNDYRAFLIAYRAASSQSPDQRLATVRKYDFEFDKWPVTFSAHEAADQRPRPSLSELGISDPRTAFGRNSGASLFQQAIGPLLTKTILRRLIYPGSVSLFVAPVVPQINQMRADLIKQFHGQRNKLIARDGNSIDTMLIDQRALRTRNSEYLFVCCEGNFGFYEIGIMSSAIQAGYTSLGWNHPGFMGSTGEPYPDQDVNAIDVVMKFATDRLGFDLDHIILFGWSIGSFPASYAAVAYPGVRGLILDSAFDHVTKLALARTPPPLRNLISVCIRNYFDLNVGRLLEQYTGPVLLVRRSFEEITCMDPDNSRPTNQINGLLVSLLNSRYPGLLNSPLADDTPTLVTLLEQWLKNDRDQQTQMLNQFGPNETQCLQILKSSASEKTKDGEDPEKASSPFPVTISPHLSPDERQMILMYLLSNHWGEFGSTHCTPLPPSFLAKLPFDLAAEMRAKSSRL